jgi:phytoene dehydrogenase-like protein
MVKAMTTLRRISKFGRHHLKYRHFSTSEEKYQRSSLPYVAPARSKRDVIIIGGGHNGLVAAAYLAKAGIDTLVLERRHCVGGAAVTEEIIPGFKFSRASYLAGLLRPQIIEDLNLAKYGFKYLSRDPSSFTPTLLNSKHKGKYLLLGSNEKENWESIAQFSKKDADAYFKYEEFLGKVREILQPLLDAAPPDIFYGTVQDRVRALKTIAQLTSVGYRHREILVRFYELMVGPAQQILDRWFESDVLKATLATDAVIGAAVSPRQNGSAYVLVHHGSSPAAPARCPRDGGCVVRARARARPRNHASRGPPPSDPLGGPTVGPTRIQPLR